MLRVCVIGMGPIGNRHADMYRADPLAGLVGVCDILHERADAAAARLGVPVHTRGTLLVGVDAGDVQQVERQLSVLDLAGVSYERLVRRELLAREPGLGRVAGGAFLAEDHSVDPRAVVAALLDRLSTLVEPGERQRAGVETNTVTVIATGANLPDPYSSLIRPVRGDVVRVRTQERVERTVRAWAHGEQIYVVPRIDSDEVVIGATTEERDGPLLPTVEGVWRLLDSARRVVPALDRASVVEVTSRDRPGTADNLPLVGSTHEPGVVLAAGAYRNGVLLAPLIAQLVADHIETGSVEPAVDPRRFQGYPVDRGSLGLTGTETPDKSTKCPSSITEETDR